MGNIITYLIPEKLGLLVYMKIINDVCFKNIKVFSTKTLNLVIGTENLVMRHHKKNFVWRIGQRSYQTNINALWLWS